MGINVTSVSVNELLAETAWVRRLAAALCRDSNDAEDLTQETLGAAMFARRPDAQSLRPWLARVVRNRFFNLNRERGRREAREHVAAAPDVPVPTPEELTECLELQRELADLLMALSEPVRHAILLRFYEGLTAAEIARRLSVPAGTVRWRLKEGLDELRRRLSARAGTRLRDWRAILAPVVGRQAVAKKSRSALVGFSIKAIAVAAIAFLLLTAGALVLGGSPLLRSNLSSGGYGGLTVGSRSADQATSASGTSSAHSTDPSRGVVGRGARTTAVLAAAAAGQAHEAPELGACVATLVRSRSEIATLESEYRDNLPAELVYERHDGVNVAARDALMPFLEKHLGPQASAGLSFSLECRSWACRLTATEPSPPTNGDWSRSLRDDRGFRDRTAGAIHFTPAVPVKDPLSGQPLVEWNVHFSLAQPSGAARGDVSPVASSMDEASQPASIPKTIEGCRSELARLQAQLGDMRSTLAKRATPTYRFDHGTPNRILLDEVGTLLARAAGRAGAVDPAVECRADVCRVQLGPWFKNMSLGTELKSRLAYGVQTTREWAYYAVESSNRPSGSELLRRLLDRFEASRAPASCFDRYPGAGRLETRFHVPGEGERNDDGERRRISVRYGGTLAGTPLGRCLEDRIARDVVAITLPPRVRKAIEGRTLVFPLENL